MVPRDFITTVVFLLGVYTNKSKMSWADSRNDSTGVDMIGKIASLQLETWGMHAMFGYKPQSLPKIEFRIKREKPKLAWKSLSASREPYQLLRSAGAVVTVHCHADLVRPGAE